MRGWNRAVTLGGVTVYLGGLAVVALVAVLLALGVGDEPPDLILQLEGFVP